MLLMAFMAAALSSVSMASGLRYNFYNTSCPGAEDKVRSVVQSLISNDATMGAAFVRLFFHDCFVRVRVSMFKMLKFLGIVSSRNHFSWPV
jgi:peroxidase